MFIVLKSIFHNVVFVSLFDSGNMKYIDDKLSMLNIHLYIKNVNRKFKQKLLLNEKCFLMSDKGHVIFA
jgi:hypothetical protein